MQWNSLVGFSLTLVVACGAPAEDELSSRDAGPRDANVGLDGAANDAGRDAGTADLSVRDVGPLADAGAEVYAGCDAYYEAICHWSARCRSKSVLLSALLEQPACSPALRRATCEVVGESFTDGRRRFAAGQPDACAAALLADDCSGGAFPSACLVLYAGQRGNGEACFGNNDCTSGACSTTEATCPGTCQPATADNQACGGSTPGACQATSYCSTGDHVCKPQAAPGASCEVSALVQSCQFGYWCVGDQGQATCLGPQPTGNTCVSTFVGGPSCEGDLLCPNGICAPGAGLGEACMGTSCAPRLKCGDAQTCIASAEPGDACTSSQECPIGFACLQGTCAVGPVLGDSCDAQRRCGRGTCDNGTCQLIVDGEPCTLSSECGELACVSRRCRPRLPEGASCAAGDACGISARCIGGLCTYCPR